MQRLGLALALLLGAWGCGDSAGKQVGSDCTDFRQCETGPLSTCIEAWPAGYCTEFACTEGSCPQGSRCVRGLSFPNVNIDAFCLATCNQTSDCRDDYRCQSVSAPEKVCVPARS